jgi:hypothetical protein
MDSKFYHKQTTQKCEDRFFLQENFFAGKIILSKISTLKSPVIIVLE